MARLGLRILGEWLPPRTSTTRVPPSSCCINKSTFKLYAAFGYASLAITLHMTDIEILVHTSAPSRGQDDARYRALARAYLDFIPHTHQPLSEPPHILQTTTEETDASTQSHEDTKIITQEVPASWASYHLDEDEQSESAPSRASHNYLSQSQIEISQPYMSSQLSFGSAIDNADSPPFQPRVTCSQGHLPDSTDPQGSQEPSSLDSYRPPPSTIADSQPSYQRGLTAASSPTRMLELYRQLIDSSRESPTGQALLSQTHDNQASTKNHDAQLELRPSSQELLIGRSSDSANQPTLPTLRSIRPRQTPSSSLEFTDPNHSTSPLVRRFIRSVRRDFGVVTSSPSNTENVDMIFASAPAILQTSSPRDKQTEHDLLAVTTLYGSMPSFNSGFDALLSPTSLHKGRTRPPIFEMKNTKNPSVPSPLAEATAASSRTKNSNADPFANESDVALPMTSTPPVMDSSLPRVSLNGRGVNQGGLETIIPETPALNLPADPQTVPSGFDGNTNDPLIRKTREDIPSTQDPASRLKRPLLDASPNSEIKSSSAPAKMYTQADSTPNLPTRRPSKRQRLDSDIIEQSQESAPPTSSPAQELPSDMPPHSQLSDLTHKMEIYVVPATSSAHLEPHMFITEGLRYLAVKLPLATYFKPLEQTRDLEEMERGHWLLKCDSWSEDLRRRCWNCIGNFLTQERAGWTVGLTRNDDFGLMKVFCWSNTAPYVYLLIYIASEGKVKKIGATWMDGGSNAIITMPP